MELRLMVVEGLEVCGSQIFADLCTGCAEGEVAENNWYSGDLLPCSADETPQCQAGSVGQRGRTQTTHLSAEGTLRGNDDRHGQICSCEFAQVPHELHGPLTRAAITERRTKDHRLHRRRGKRRLHHIIVDDVTRRDLLAPTNGLVQLLLGQLSIRRWRQLTLWRESRSRNILEEVVPETLFALPIGRFLIQRQRLPANLQSRHSVSPRKVHCCQGS
mmetsp:Transcript_8946/g.24949  ORF Transcript_8946/g.24949 Transcript_8946/m.24949 type:complete len:217 (+) Transcript_8946:513-1163(+)